MRLLSRRTRVVALICATMPGVLGAHAGDVTRPCVPPLVESEARCTFDIYGYVTDINGRPYPNVHITDGTHTTYTDARGFYDLWEIQMGNYFLSFDSPIPGCYTGTHQVTTTYRTILDGGTRHDAQLPCTVP